MSPTGPPVVTYPKIKTRHGWRGSVAQPSGKLANQHMGPTKFSLKAPSETPIMAVVKGQSIERPCM
eukprot:scaffold528_cov165-Amphora_coffeaeformis.AAC.53